MAGADLRLLVLGAAAWLAALLTQGLPGWPLLGALALLTLSLAAAAARGARGPVVVTAAAALLVGSAVVAGAWLRQEQLGSSPVAELADEGATVSVVATVISDPRTVSGRFADRVMLRLRVHDVTGRGRTHRLAAPVVLLGDPTWRDVELGSRVGTSGRVVPAEGGGVAGLLLARGDPEVIQGPDVWWRGAEAVRASLRDSVAHRPLEQRALVPALVDGDDAAVPVALADDFRTTGLTHLLAVSGTNLTLLVGFLLVLARWCGVRGRWLGVVGALGIAGFVLLARTEPSVLRAAVMGAVGLAGMGANGRQRGTRSLGLALIGLLLVDPELATSVGFALSVLATGGILLLAPGWRDALARWLPRWLAEAIAVPAAAQLTCTPLVAAISGQVSVAAVVANLLVAPVVGPATVLGLVAGLLGLVWDPAGRLAGTGAAWCVAWIVTVAQRGAQLPGASFGWGTGAGALVLLTLTTVLVALAAPFVLRRRWAGAACCLLLVLGLLVRLPTPGWPPRGWVLVTCDVGQGDALVLRAGEGTAVVVDAGPAPTAVDACLDRLEVHAVPLVVLTHFHADHVDGLPGVLEDRAVGAIESTSLEAPPGGVRLVDDLLGAERLPRTVSPYAATRTVGDVTLQALWPPPGAPTSGPADGSTANDASVVLLAEVRGVRLLLTGDLEPEGQAALSRSLPTLAVDVLKVPHHGSRYQDLDFLTSLGASIALVSVGAENDYGHPDAATLAGLSATGALVRRTDLDGDVAVLSRDGRLLVVSSR